MPDVDNADIDTVPGAYNDFLAETSESGQDDRVKNFR